MQNSARKCVRCGLELRDHYRAFHAFTREWPSDDAAANEAFAAELEKLTR